MRHNEAMSSRALPATFTTVHPLSSSQRERRQRLLIAARELAGEGGYAAVTMHAVADRAKLARATVYRYFGSKDQLLTAAGVEWAREIADEQARGGIRVAGGSAAEQMAELMAAVIDHSAAELPLMSAMVSAIISGDRTADRERRALYAIMLERFDEIMGDGLSAEERADMAYLLGQLMLAALTSLCMLEQPAKLVRDMAIGAAHRLLP